MTVYNFLQFFMYAIDWQSPGVFTCTQALPFSRSECKITYWQCAHKGKDFFSFFGDKT